MKFEDIKKLIDGLTSDMDSLKDKTNPTFNRRIEVGELRGVIDVSLGKEVKIPKENFADKPVIKDYKYWILKLDRYHKSPAMRINQLNTSSLKMYAKLADKLEAELNKKGTTVARLVSKLRREGVNYDLYYTLYLIAEATVINHYNPLANKSVDRSYDFLEKVTSKNIRDLIANEAIKLTSELKEPDKEVREFYNLTEDNKVSLWWDPDASLREKYHFTKDEVLAINQITKRNNVLWKNKKIFDMLMDLFLSTVRAVIDDPDVDSRGIVNIITPYKQSKQILDSILVYSEFKLRDQFSFLNCINANSAIDELKAYDDGRLIESIRNHQKEYFDNLDFELIHEINLNYFDKNPNKYQEIGKYLAELDTNQQIAMLSRYEDTENFDKLLIHLDKWQSLEKGFIPLYYIYKRGINKSRHEKSLTELIHPENVGEFIRLVNENELSEDLIKEFEKLDAKPTKKISMNRERIADSKSKLKDTVDLVNEFLDEDEEEIPEELVKEPEEAKTDIEYGDILNKILEEGSIGTDDMADMAKDAGVTLNIFVNQINDSLYDYIGDQTIVIEGDSVIIDEFYVDMVREIVNAN